jgi:hypothetical protein
MECCHESHSKVRIATRNLLMAGLVCVAGDRETKQVLYLQTGVIAVIVFSYCSCIAFV